MKIDGRFQTGDVGLRASAAVLSAIIGAVLWSSGGLVPVIVGGVALAWVGIAAGSVTGTMVGLGLAMVSDLWDEPGLISYTFASLLSFVVVIVLDFANHTRRGAHTDRRTVAATGAMVGVVSLGTITAVALALAARGAISVPSALIPVGLTAAAAGAATARRSLQQREVDYNFDFRHGAQVGPGADDVE